MGSNDGKEDERPVHEVKVATFCVDVTEVTASAYHGCMQGGGCATAESTVKWANIPDEVRERESAACTIYQTDNQNLPMNCVSWDDAAAFCAAAGKRLPTEAEWEYAASGGPDKRRFPWGAEPPSARLLNACDPSCVAALEEAGSGKQRPLFDEDDGAPQLAPVGRYPAGKARSGALDMAGNAWEWTASPYCPYPERACSNQNRVFRGGGWGSLLVASLRTTGRMWSHPSHRYNDVGFRCVKDPQRP